MILSSTSKGAARRRMAALGGDLRNPILLQLRGYGGCGSVTGRMKNALDGSQHRVAPSVPRLV